MNQASFEQIIASLDGKEPWELRILADMIRERFGIPRPPMTEAEKAYWTPSYSLILVRVECRPEHKLALIKAIRNLSGCGLREAKELVENAEGLPLVIWSSVHEHPSECRRETRELRAQLEALGAVLDEDYNYGYFD